MEKINISVLGCCVSRDAIACNEEQYNVQRYCPWISPYTILNGAHKEISIDELKCHNLSGIEARSVYLDSTKTAFDYLAEVKSDWLLFDLNNNICAEIAEWDGIDYILSLSGNGAKKIQAVQNVLNIGKPKKYCPWDIPKDEFKRRLVNYLEHILAIYNPHQIIFNLYHRVDKYLALGGGGGKRVFLIFSKVKPICSSI